MDQSTGVRGLHLKTPSPADMMRIGSFLASPAYCAASPPYLRVATRESARKMIAFQAWFARR